MKALYIKRTKEKTLMSAHWCRLWLHNRFSCIGYLLKVSGHMISISRFCKWSQKVMWNIFYSCFETWKEWWSHRKSRPWSKKKVSCVIKICFSFKCNYKWICCCLCSRIFLIKGQVDHFEIFLLWLISD